MIKPWASQIDLAIKAVAVLKEHKIVYLGMEERTGKSITALLALESIPSINTCLVITTKAALINPKDSTSGWSPLLGEIALDSNFRVKYTVTTYYQLHKLQYQHFSAIILDEPHVRLGSKPGNKGKPKTTIIKVRDIILSCGIEYSILMSATPYAMGLQTLYHQLWVTGNSPWREGTYLKWYERYAKRDSAGRTSFFYNRGVPIKTYEDMDDFKLKGTFEHIFITATRVELGFKVEPVDKLHFIELNKNTKKAMNIIAKKKVLQFKVDSQHYIIVASTIQKLKVCLHMMEGGTCKAEEVLDRNILRGVTLKENSKIDYIKQEWGDSSNVVIMYNYKQEKLKLESSFNNACILQATSFAEGVDLSMYDHLIIYSQNFSPSKHSQRRARQVNRSNNKPIIVHFLLVDSAISYQVYDAVSTKKIRYVDSLYKQFEL